MAGRLAELDLSLEVSEEEYDEAYGRTQLDLLVLQQELREARRAVVIAFEGWDAAGKGGAIKRLVNHLDPRGYQVYTIGAPTQEELDHHFLWRFWIRLPRAGQIGIFDRSWYGRVLAERVKRLTPKARWKAAYDEINAFEKNLMNEGTIILKFWLHISKAEQLRRFRARERSPYKRWKIGPEDWENRRAWDAYLKAAEEMFEKTGTARAPWRLIEAEHKSYGRLKVLRETVGHLSKSLGTSRKKRKR
ncbi:MAG: UDP-galactose-lipid carrier transferase [Deltaproteobacteria bacterium]|nr:UDP-galactose-lipid carrier transferase [Deltaproteobacteria bacterium]